MSSIYLEPALSVVLQSEGGYSNHPMDPGKETFLGISRRYFPNWEGWRTIDRMKKARLLPSVSDLQLRPLAIRFYEREFYNRIGGDGLGSIELATEMLDQSINLGVDRAARHLQTACNFLNRNGRSWPEILVDGKIGPTTLKTIAFAEPKHLVRVLNALQAEFYLNAIRIAPEKEEFIRGWLDRT